MSNIEAVVMRRARVVHMTRPFLSNGAFAALIAVAALWGIGREVWVAKVFENAPHQDMLAALQFFARALENTHLAVQILVAVAVAATIYLARETARFITRPAFAI